MALLELSDERAWLAQTPLHEPLAVVASVANSYAQRFDSLASGARQMLVLFAASDAGDLSALVRPASALGLDVDDLASGEAAGLVDVRDARVEWRHPLVRSAVYGRAAPGERRAAHRAVADALPDADDDRRAWHLALAALGPDAVASSALEQAGIRARDRSAYDVASRTFERAAALAPDERATWSPALSPLPTRHGSAASAIEPTSCLDEAEGHGHEPGLRIAIEHLRGHVATRRGHVARGPAHPAGGGGGVAAIDPPRAVVMLADAVHASFYLGDAAAMRRIAEQYFGCRRPPASTPALSSSPRWPKGWRSSSRARATEARRLIRHAVAVSTLLGRAPRRPDPPRLGGNGTAVGSRSGRGRGARRSCARRRAKSVGGGRVAVGPLARRHRSWDE